MITVDPEFQALIPPLSPEELAQLEENILRDGCRDPLVVWVPYKPDPGSHKCYGYDESKCDLVAGDGVWACRHCDHNPALMERVLVDGHNRYAICTKHGLDFDTEELEFGSREEALDWIDANQLGRRNLSPEQMSLLRGRIYNRSKKAIPNESGRNQHQEVEGQNVHQPKTSEVLGERFGVSGKTVQRDGQFAASVESLKEHVPDIESRVMSGEVKRRDVVEAAKSPEIAGKILAHVANNSGNNEWYTPAEYIEAARRVMGGIDVDPASSAIANSRVQASTYFTAEDDGLKQEWHGRVWMNPPYAQPLIANFADAVAEKYAGGEIEQACVLVNNATDTAWFHAMLSEASAVCFPRGRIRFIDPQGNPSGAPLQGQAVLYFGESAESFATEFSQFGRIVHVDHDAEGAIQGAA